MTARRVEVRLRRTALTAVRPAAIVCASADLFRVPSCSKATVSNPTTEQCVPLLQPIERDVQLRGNSLGLISDDDRLDIDPFV
jgi:hypothetical protein